MSRLVVIARKGALWVLLGICFLWAVASVTLPFGWDQGIMAAVGDVIVRGGMPYADGWDMKGPLPYYVFALFERLFGHQMWGVRTLELALLVAASVSLGRMVGRLTIPTAAPWVSIALILWYASGGYFFTAQPDGWVALGITLCIAPTVGREDPIGIPGFLAWGLVTALAVLVKPLYGAFLAIPALDLALLLHRHEIRRALLSALVLAGAFLAPLAVAVGWFAVRGALDDLIDVHVRYAALSYAGLGSLRFWARARGLLAFLLSGKIAVLLPIACLGGYVAWQLGRRTALLLWGWVAIAFFGVILQAKFFTYQWIPTFPPLIAVTALGIYALFSSSDAESSGSRLRVGPPRLLAVIAIVFAMSTLVYAPMTDIRKFVPLALGRIEIGEYYGRFGLPAAPYTPGDEWKAARYLNSHTSDNDGLVIFGTNAAVLYLSDRSTPTRFVFSMPVMDGRPIRAEYRAEFMADIRGAAPAYAIVGMTIDGGPKERSLESFPEFAEWLANGYQREIQIGHLDLYRRILP